MWGEVFHLGRRNSKYKEQKGEYCCSSEGSRGASRIWKGRQVLCHGGSCRPWGKELDFILCGRIPHATDEF